MGNDNAVPPLPTALVQPAEYVWGDVVAARDERLARHVIGGLGQRYGHAREAHYVVEAEHISEMAQDFAARFGAGRQQVPLATVLGPGENGLGFVREDTATVIAWLPAQPDGRVPVTVFTFGKNKN